MTAPAREAEETQFSEFPVGTSLVRHQTQAPDLATPQQIAAYAQAFDDQAFLAGIMGEAMDKWFYEFKIAGKQIEGVSVVGAEEFARLRAEQGYPIRFPSGSVIAREVTRNGELGIEVTVVAREARTGADGLGMAFYPYMVERVKNEETIRVADNFPDRKALSVAKRNAILDLIPQGTIIAVLKQRKAIMAVNQQREDDRVKAIVEGRRAVAKPAATRVITNGAQRSETPDPYAAADASVTGPVMRFGRTKGTPLSKLDTKDIESARKWASDTDAVKFADALDELDSELERRREDQSSLDISTPAPRPPSARGNRDALAQP